MKYTKYLLVLLLFAGTMSCELSDNINPKEAAVVPAELVFTNAEVALWNQVNSIDQNFNISRLLAQYNTQTTYYGESTWNFYDRSLPDRMWRSLYRDALIDFKEARSLIAEDPSITEVQKNTNYAIIDVCEVYAYHVLVDVNGDVPYTDAVEGRANKTPVYDDAATIYTDLINRLTEDVAVFGAVDAESSFSSAEVLYGGDVNSWRLFANSLRLRLAMRLADVNPSVSKTQAELAITAGVFTSQSESAKLVYTGVTPHFNTIHDQMVARGRRDFVAANTIVDTMNLVNDPRRAYYFTQVEGEYVGGRYGFRNVYGQNSSFPDKMREASYPANIMDFVEVEFLLAEAAARGYTVSGGDAESHYINAVTESILDWGGTTLEATAYLAQPSIAYVAADYRAKIGFQKWIAMYDRGLEGWASYRIFDTPTMNIARNKTAADFPLRMPYPFNENNLNLANYTAASAAIGGDVVSTPIFWDRFDMDGNPR